MNSLPRFLSKEAILLLHRQQIERFGGASGIRDQALLESALGAAKHHWHYGGDLYQTAAQYCYSLANNHPFLDGNKRVAAASMLIFLALIVTGEIGRDDLAKLLRSVSESF